MCTLVAGVTRAKDGLKLDKSRQLRYSSTPCRKELTAGRPCHPSMMA